MYLIMISQGGRPSWHRSWNQPMWWASSLVQARGSFLPMPAASGEGGSPERQQKLFEMPPSSSSSLFQHSGLRQGPSGSCQGREPWVGSKLNSGSASALGWKAPGAPDLAGEAAATSPAGPASCIVPGLVCQCCSSQGPEPAPSQVGMAILTPHPQAALDQHLDDSRFFLPPEANVGSSGSSSPSGEKVQLQTPHSCSGFTVYWLL